MNISPATIRAAAVAIAIAVTGLTAPALPTTAPQLPESTAAELWADSVMSTMTPAERVAQLFVPRLDITDNAAGHASLRRQVADNHVGGFLLGKGTTTGYASLIAGAQKAAKVPLLVTLDGEWGLAMRVNDAPRFPYNMGLGAVSDPAVLYEYGKEVARECRAVGINVCFAPVLDVNSNPENPVIGYRSFGDNPERVALLGTAYSRGLEDGGVMSVAKHFPGHGDTSTDSHKTLPTVDHTAGQMRTTDLLPFQRYADAGLSGIMTGHLRVPSLDPTGTPASLSHAITTDLLRNSMHFGGLIFTDALAMKGAVAKSGQNNCVTALLAGADVLLQPASPAVDIAAVRQAIADGILTQERIDSSCRRILAYKYRLGLNRPSDAVAVSSAKSAVNAPQAEAVAERLARASITVVRNSDLMLPIEPTAGGKIAVVSLGAEASNQFSRICAHYADTERLALTTATVPESTMEALRKAEAVIVGVFTDAQWARKAYAKLVSLPRMAGVFFVNPYQMASFGMSLREQPTLVAAYDDTPELRRAASEALFGGIEVTGRFPVNVPAVADEGAGTTLPRIRLGYSTPGAQGMSPKLTARIDSIVTEAIEVKAFPGCQVVVVRKGEVVHSKAYGNVASGSTTEVTENTLYDIASMTKATATLGGVMKAYDEGMFELDAPLSRYVPGLDTPEKRALKVSDFLYHESGMPAIIPINKIMMDPESYSGALTSGRARAPYSIKISRGVYGNSNARLRRDMVSKERSEAFPVEIADGVYGAVAIRDTVMQRIYDAPLRSAGNYRYSCLNFCLLMEMEENLTGSDHSEWVEAELFRPLGASRTLYKPTSRFAAAEIAPTERDPFLRRQLLRGHVHDEIAAFSGGVQGNAGLFSTATDIAKYAQMLLNGGTYGGKRIISAETIEKFTGSRSRSGKRALGFDLLLSQKSMDGTGASERTYGHTGFTGTCFWIDPEEEIVFVFLSNRVNPSRDNSTFSRLNPRRAIFNEIYRALPQK